MRYSAKHGPATACRLSVRLSVTLMDHDHIGRKSWKLIVGSIIPTSSLFVAQTSSTYSQGNMEKFGRLEVRWEKVACWSIKAAISLKRVKILGSTPYFYFRFRLCGHRDGRFCLIFARTAQQLVLDGTNGLSSSKPCMCVLSVCGQVHRADIFAIAQLSCLSRAMCRFAYGPADATADAGRIQIGSGTGSPG